MKQFQRRIESFECEQCGTVVSGDGYTNHCPNCLWSKHVDIYPGDRANPCKGAMEPVAIRVQGSCYRILHRCTRCGTERYNRTSANDSFDQILHVMKGANRRIA